MGLRDAWYRLITRIVARKEAGPYGARIKADQLDVGVRGGCEIGGHIAQLHTRVEVTAEDIINGDDFVVGGEDGRNCYNEIALGPALDQMRQDLPRLTRGFWWLIRPCCQQYKTSIFTVWDFIPRIFTNAPVHPLRTPCACVFGRFQRSGHCFGSF